MKAKSICEECKNKLELTYQKLPFRFNKNTGEQLNTELLQHNEPCIYVKFRYGSTWDEILVKTCNQFKPII